MVIAMLLEGIVASKVHRIIDYRVEGLEAAHAKNYPRIARSWRELQKIQKVSEFFPSNKTFAAEMATSTGQSRV